MNNIKKVIDNDYCIGCGACAVVNNKITIQRNIYGLKTACYESIDSLTEDDNYVCPFATSLNETILGEKYFSETPDILHDDKIGYYLDFYAGKIENDEMRLNTSSGGLLSWLLNYLLECNLIDGVIHVKSTVDEPDLFQYTISKTTSEILERGKSRYYNISFEEVKDFLLSDNIDGKYVFVGVPCYVKALRLLCEKRPLLNKHIVYFFALFCGHMKSSAFAELLSWQQGIKPRDLKMIDFRIKNKEGLSSKYSVQVENKDSFKTQEKNYLLYGSDWGLGFFKPKACDWCDDISGELADITFGDAWLPEYTKDPLGTNIIIVRNQLLNGILQSANKSGDLYLDRLNQEKIIASQAGNYRHRHEGLSVRIERAESINEWFPMKRIQAKEYNISYERKKLYLIREEMAIKSHKYFLDAKNKDKLLVFALKMFPLELKYAYYNQRFIKGSIKACLNLLTISLKKGKQI